MVNVYEGKFLSFRRQPCPSVLYLVGCSWGYTANRLIFTNGAVGHGWELCTRRVRNMFWSHKDGKAFILDLFFSSTNNPPLSPPFIDRCPSESEFLTRIMLFTCTNQGNLGPTGPNPTNLTP